MKNIEKEIVRIGKAAELLGVSKETLKNWDKAKVFQPEFRLPGSKHRYYTLIQIQRYKNEVLKIRPQYLS